MTKEEELKNLKTAIENSDVPMREKLLETFYSYHPELKESENERTRKEIVNYLDFAESHNLLRAADYEKKKKWLAYLEKQKEREPFTIEEERTLQEIILYLEDETCPTKWRDLLSDIYNYPYVKQKPAERDDTDVKKTDGIIADGIITKSIDGGTVFVESSALDIDPNSVRFGDKVKLIVIK